MKKGGEEVGMFSEPILSMQVGHFFAKFAFIIYYCVSLQSGQNFRCSSTYTLYNINQLMILWYLSRLARAFAVRAHEVWK